MRARSPLEFFRALLVFAAIAVSCTFVSSAVFAAAPSGVVDGVGIHEQLGSQVSIDSLHFRDETGKDLPLSTYFHHGRPVILSMVYYECPNLCTLSLNGLTESLRALKKTLKWTAGERFDIVVVSINPKDTPSLAAKKKAAYLEAYGQDGNPGAWHFLTGEESQIRELASQTGFYYKPYRDGGRSGELQFAHSSAIYVLSAEGKIARYLYGIDYRPRDLRLALLEASHGKIGSSLDRLLRLCYRWNPRTRHYEAAPDRVIAWSAGAGGAGTVLIFGGFLAVLRRREKEKERV